MPFRPHPLRSILAAAGALLVACAPAREAALPAAPPTTPASATATPASLEPAQPSDPDVIPALADDRDDNPYLPSKASSRRTGGLSARDPARQTP